MIRVLAVLSVLVLAGCSFETVPPTTKGKILTTSGYTPDILEPGKYTLWGRDQLVLLETNTNVYKETVTVILSDKLTLTVDIRFRGRIEGNAQTINAMFNDIKAGDDRRVTFRDVYSVYGRPAVRNRTRAIISNYNVDEVHKNYARLSTEIAESLHEALKPTPLEISEVALGDIQYPKVVTEAIELAKEREMAIKQEEAQAEIELTKKKNERVLAETDYQIKITQAKAVRDSNKIIGQGVTPELLQLRALEVQEEMINALTAAGNTTFMPFNAFDNSGLLMQVPQLKRSE